MNKRSLLMLSLFSLLFLAACDSSTRGIRPKIDAQGRLIADENFLSSRAAQSALIELFEARSELSSGYIVKYLKSHKIEQRSNKVVVIGPDCIVNVRERWFNLSVITENFSQLYHGTFFYKDGAWHAEIRETSALDAFRL